MSSVKERGGPWECYTECYPGGIEVVCRPNGWISGGDDVISQIVVMGNNWSHEEAMSQAQWVQDVLNEKESKR